MIHNRGTDNNRVAHHTRTNLGATNCAYEATVTLFISGTKYDLYCSIIFEQYMEARLWAGQILGEKPLEALLVKNPLRTNGFIHAFNVDGSPSHTYAQ